MPGSTATTEESARVSIPRWSTVIRHTQYRETANQRLLAFDGRSVSFRWKDYREKGRTRYKAMTLESSEFMRRFI